MFANVAMAVLPALRMDPLLSQSAGVASPLSDITSYFGSSSMLWATGLIFLRVSGVVMLIPGIGDTGVPPRLRLGFALLFAAMLAPVVGATLPGLPSGLGEMFGQVLHEVIIGLILGTLLRVMIFTLVIAGEVMSLQTTLSFAQTANPTEAQPSTSLGTFLAMLGLVMIYATNTHHLFIRAIVDSYQVFAPVKKIMLNDAATLMVRTMSQSFVLALQMSAPLIVFALIFNVATGFVGRVMPNFPVFFAATPLTLLLGLSLLAMGVGSMGMVFIDHYQDMLGIFIRGKA
ncbi:MAG: flagellar biosynthetic protein FliR [Asticcacaulis sp.]